MFKFAKINVRKIINKIVLFLYQKGRHLSQFNYERKLRAKYSIPDSFRFNGKNIYFYGNGILSIGENSYVGEYSTIQVQDGCMVKIGNNCRISHNVRIYTTSNCVDQDFNSPKIEIYSKNVTIGSGVWIGANVFINPGVDVGNNAIIGANAVITKDVPANAVVGGVPAKVIRFKEMG